LSLRPSLLVLLLALSACDGGMPPIYFGCIHPPNPDGIGTRNGCVINRIPS